MQDGRGSPDIFFPPTPMVDDIQDSCVPSSVPGVMTIEPQLNAPGVSGSNVGGAFRAPIIGHGLEIGGTNYFCDIFCEHAKHGFSTRQQPSISKEEEYLPHAIMYQQRRIYVQEMNESLYTAKFRFIEKCSKCENLCIYQASDLRMNYLDILCASCITTVCYKITSIKFAHCI